MFVCAMCLFKVLSNLLHCADLGNPCKPEELYVNWVERVMDDNFVQGDKERAMGVSISPLMDRYNVSIPKSQVGFIKMHAIEETKAWSL